MGDSSHAEIREHAQRNFALGSYADTNSQSRPMYRMTAKGLSKLAMRLDFQGVRRNTTSVMVKSQLAAGCRPTSQGGRFMKLLIGSLFALLVAGCATPYQRDGYAGGFTETQLDVNVFRVTFKGNAVTAADRAEDMALLRSAELALQHGFSHFAIADGRSRSETVTIDTPAQATTRGTISTYGNTSYLNTRTKVTGGDSFTVVKPSTTNIIVCFKGRPQISAFVYDAQFIVNSLGPKYGLPPK